MRRNIILGDKTDAMLVRLSKENGLDMTATVTEAIRQMALAAWPPVRVGYIRIDRLDGDPEQQCTECDGLLSGSGWVVLYSDHTMRAPVCDRCAK